MEKQPRPKNAFTAAKRFWSVEIMKRSASGDLEPLPWPPEWESDEILLVLKGTELNDETLEPAEDSSARNPRRKIYRRHGMEPMSLEQFEQQRKTFLQLPLFLDDVIEAEPGAAESFSHLFDEIDFLTFRVAEHTHVGTPLSRDIIGSERRQGDYDAMCQSI